MSEKPIKNPSPISFTQPRRLNLYKEALHELEYGNKRFICSALQTVLINLGIKIPYRDVKYILPELRDRFEKYKPNREEHIKLAKECIANCSDD